MGLINFLSKILFILSIFFSLNTFSQSVPKNSDPNDGDNFDDLFDYGYSRNSKEEESYIVTSPGIYLGMECSAAASKAETAFKDIRQDSDAEKFTFESPQKISICNYSIVWYRTTYWSNGNVNKNTRSNSQLISLNFRTETVFVCPHPDFPQSKTEGYIGEALYCFDQADLNTRDSCPDSTQDGAYVLPVNDINSSDVMCLDKPDMSSCKYKKVDDVYITDFENDCYDRISLPRFDETGISQVDPTDPDCQDLGQGVSACIENPDNVCDNNGLCNIGCGSVAFGGSDPVFVCLSGDSDGDGLANYIDPDVDGDGIRNEDDLDSNGDGVDDPVYQNDRNGSGTTVNVDLGNLESLTSQGNSKLSSVESLLEEQNGSGKLPEYTSIADEITFNDSIMSRFSNAPVMLAMSSISGAIDFNTNGSCPELSFYLPIPIDKTVSTSTHCTIMPTISVIITPVMFAIYLFMGFRIFGSA
jgi:hypothetical protein